MTARGRVTGVLLPALVALTGCTAEAESPQSSSSSEATPSRPSAVPSTTTSETPSPDEQAAQTAIETFESMLQISDAASREPDARDWEPEIAVDRTERFRVTRAATSRERSRSL